MSVFIIDEALHIVLAVLTEDNAGWNGFAILKGRPTPIGARPTRDGAIAKVLALVDAAGLRVESYSIQTVEATVSVSPKLVRR